MTYPRADQSLVQQVAAEIAERRRRGEDPSADDYARRYPALADEILRLFPALTVDRAAAGHADHTVMWDDVEPAVEEQKLERLGDFRILREIGRGGMGIVYEAEQESLSRHVALKVLLATALLDPKQLSRFQREARAAARLHHTNIVPVFGVGEFQGTHYYVMQFIEGRGLDHVLAELKWLSKHEVTAGPRVSWTRRLLRFAGPNDTTAADSAQQIPPPDLTVGVPVAGTVVDARGSETVPPRGHDVSSAEVAPTQALDLSGPQAGRAYWRSVAQIGVQVAEALAYAHGQGILHRDIKPANLLLDTNGTVWVTDFGLAKATEQENLTQTGDIVGTLRYMAPESFHGQNDARTDIYALGLTLFELIALRPAFDEMDRNGLLRQVTSAQIPPLRKLEPALPADLETIVAKSLDREPSHRYQTAGELAADLQRFIHDEPILARRPSPAERLERWCRRNPVVAALTLSLVLVFATGFAGVTWKWREAEHQKDQLALAQEEIVRERNLALQARDEAGSEREKAEEARQAAVLSEAQAKKSARVAMALNRFLVDDMLAAAAPERARGRKLTVEEVLREAGKKVHQSLESQPEVEASVHNTIGITFLRMGLYADAEPHLRRALELREAALGPEHLDTLGAMNNLAQLLKAQGKLAEAEPLYRRSWEVRSRVLGDENPETLGALSNLAQLLLAQGKLAEAEPLARESWHAFERVLGQDDPDTLLAKGNLAMIWQRQGKSAEAEPMLRETLKSLTSGLGAEHPYTMTTMHNLAGLLQAKGELADAEKLYRDALDARRRVLGPEHPDTLVTMNQLATLLQDAGKLAEAEPLVRQSFELSTRILGDDHPQTSVARHNLARLLQAQGRFDEAEPLVRKTAEACRRVLGPEHLDTLVALANLSVVLQSQGKLEEAEPIVREVLEVQRRVLGPEHPHTLISENNLAVLLQAEGRLEEAEPLVRANLAACRKTLGPDHTDTLLAMSNLAAVLVARGKLAEAEPLVREGLDVRSRVLGADHLDTLNAMDDLVTLLTAQSKLDEAQKLLVQLVERRRQVLGVVHPDTLKAINSLALVDQARGDLKAAEPLLRELVEVQSRVHGPRHHDTLGATSALATLLDSEGKTSEADAMFRQVLDVRRKIPAPDPEIADALASLGKALLGHGHAQQALPLLEEAVKLDRQALPDGHWHTAYVENLLGSCLTDLERFEEAEPLLLTSFGILQVKRSSQPRVARQALERIVHLYEAWKKPEQAADWKSKLLPAKESQPEPLPGSF
jgi:eukaryotic-like serine/threonine-protein kinase